MTFCHQQVIEWIPYKLEITFKKNCYLQIMTLFLQIIRFKRKYLTWTRLWEIWISLCFRVWCYYERFWLLFGWSVTFDSLACRANATDTAGAFHVHTLPYGRKATNAKKCIFLLRISLVNVNKSAGDSGFVHIY